MGEHKHNPTAIEHSAPDPTKLWAALARAQGQKSDVMLRGRMRVKLGITPPEPLTIDACDYVVELVSTAPVKPATQVVLAEMHREDAQAFLQRHHEAWERKEFAL